MLARDCIINMVANDKFDVFIEGTRDASPQGVARAAQALAPKLAMTAERVERLLSARFRVRSGLDEESARKLTREPEAAGLRVAVAPAGARPTAAAPASPPP